MSFSLQGLAVSKGTAIGPVYIVHSCEPEISEAKVEHLEDEVMRFESALEMARQQLHDIRRQAIDHQLTEDIAAFIDIHLLMLSDTMLTETPIELIQNLRCNAEWALKLQRDRLITVFEEMEDPYLRTRKEDVDQVINRLQLILSNQASPSVELASSFKPNSIVIASDLTPADTVLMQHHGIAGFVTEYGGTTSHTAILARSLGIPAVVGLRQARRYIKSDDTVVVDGNQGVVLVNPDKQIIRHYRNRQIEERRHRTELSKLREAPTITLDGIPISLHANIELPEDIAAVQRCGAEGVGLYRTEFLYMNRQTLPNEEEHLAAYEQVVLALKGGTVTIRTLDLGADKPAPALLASRAISTNPALGLRAIRICLKDVGLLKPQLRAILRVSYCGSVRLLIPMISSLQELLQVRELISETQKELTAEGLRFDPHLPVGVMVEVPSVAVCADLFTPYLDFMSIGTNDLIQYTLAIDRCDDEVSYLYDPLHPAVLRLLKKSIRAAKQSGKPISMCGEMAGDARFVRLLLGLGLRAFSVNPESLLEIKKIINNTRISNIMGLTNRVLQASKSEEIGELVEQINTI